MNHLNLCITKINLLKLWYRSGAAGTREENVTVKKNANIFMLKNTSGMNSALRNQKYPYTVWFIYKFSQIEFTYLKRYICNSRCWKQSMTLQFQNISLRQYLKLNIKLSNLKLQIIKVQNLMSDGMIEFLKTDPFPNQPQQLHTYLGQDISSNMLYVLIMACGMFHGHKTVRQPQICINVKRTIKDLILE